LVLKQKTSKDITSPAQPRNLEALCLTLNPELWEILAPNVRK